MGVRTLRCPPLGAVRDRPVRGAGGRRAAAAVPAPVLLRALPRARLRARFGGLFGGLLTSGHGSSQSTGRCAARCTAPRTGVADSGADSGPPPRDQTYPEADEAERSSRTWTYLDGQRTAPAGEGARQLLVPQEAADLLPALRSPAHGPHRAAQQAVPFRGNGAHGQVDRAPTRTVVPLSAGT